MANLILKRATRKKYTEITAELNRAITAMQKLHAHELSLELRQQKKYI
ncbi:hypothetical protein [Lacticaseibacillus paracasei]|nr:hypothetical protein [Lacticaseibacillus paracasei]